MTSPSMRMAEAASNLIASLDAGQHARACLPFDDHSERTTWYYFPNAQSGLPFAEMTHWQQKLAHRLLLSGLSRQAYSRACQVMTLDNTLDVQEEFAAADFRDAALYYTTIFGQPGNGSWGWRFQGHHVCVNYTVAADGVISGTPLFLGANPARLQHNGRDYSRPFADTEELGRELFASLSGEARATALISERSPGDFVLANLPHPDAEPLEAGRFYLPHGGTFRGIVGPVSDNERALRERIAYHADAPAGIAGRMLTAGQRDLLGRLVDHYADRFPEGVAWSGLHDLDQLHFSWAGGANEGERHYYRLHGPALLVEYDNTQDDGNHVHSVCRHPKNDFGTDVLGLHYLWAHAAK